MCIFCCRLFPVQTGDQWSPLRFPRLLRSLKARLVSNLVRQSGRKAFMTGLCVTKRNIRKYGNTSNTTLTIGHRIVSTYHKSQSEKSDWLLICKDGILKGQCPLSRFPKGRALWRVQGRALRPRYSSSSSSSISVKKGLPQCSHTGLSS